MKKTSKPTYLARLFTLITCSLLSTSLFAAPGDVTTVAGEGIPVVSSNQAASSFSSAADDVVLDSAGNYYYPDSFNHRVYKVNAQGTISIVAGTGLPGLSGDGGLAVNATLTSPGAMAFDANGNLHIADTANNCIRKISSTGVITVAHCISTAGEFDNSSQISGFAFDSANNLYIPDTYNSVIRKVTSTGASSIYAGVVLPDFPYPLDPPTTYGDEGVATAIALRRISDVFVDASSNVYFSETGSQLIRKVDTAGMLTTIAGNGTNNFDGDGEGVQATSVGLSRSKGIFVDASGNLFIADGSHRIRKVTPQGIITTVAGSGIGFPRKSGDNGAATAAKLFNPSAVTVDTSGNIYIADTGNFSVRKVNTSGTITTAAGTGSPSFTGDGLQATSAQLYQANDVAFDAAGNLFIADTGNHRIRKVDTSGKITTIAGTGQSGFNGDNRLATSATLNSPTHIAADQNGNLYVSDYQNRRIRKIDSSGMISTIAGTGAQSFNEDDSGVASMLPLSHPKDIALDSAGNLYIVDDQRILKVDSSGMFTRFAGSSSPGYSGDNGPAIDAELRPSSIAIDESGNIFVGVDNYIRKIDTSGIITTIAGDGFTGSSGDTGPATSASLSSPEGLAADKYGNLFFTDRSNGTLRKIDANGLIRKVAVGSLSSPIGIAITNNADIYIAESGSNRIRKFEGSAPAVISTYRLYYPGNNRHLFTTSAFEYNALGGFGWIQENVAFSLYNQPTVIEGKASVPWLRLYNKSTGSHLWTTSRKEYNTLGRRGWIHEGVTGYMFESQVSQTAPLYRLYHPKNRTHLWTLDLNERTVLVTSRGWNDEGIVGYVYN